MHQEKINQMLNYFSEHIEQCSTEVNRLRTDGREDEAIFAQIRRNIYSIFQSVFTVALDQQNCTEDSIVKFFKYRIAQIPRSWETALTQAQNHGDTEKAHIESMKLDIAAEIRKKFEQIWEVSL